MATLALQTQQKAIDITAHNIANANTPGYTRQKAQMVTTEPFSYAGAGQVGTGVIVSDIERIREEFMDYQVRSEKQLMGYWETRKDSLEKIELLFMEPSETGFNSVLGKFFDSWQELSKNPESSPIRTSLVETSITLTNTVNHLNSQLDNLKQDTNEMMRIHVNDINSLADQVAALNQQIVRVTARGDSPNDLMDRRDLLLDQLSEIIDFTVVHQKNGSANVFFRGKELVRESKSYGLMVENVGSEIEIYWEKDGEPQGDPIAITRDYTLVRRRDALEGLDSVRQEVTRIQEEFNALIETITEEVNQQHQQGFTLSGEQPWTEPDPEWNGDFLIWDDTLNRLEVSSHIQEDIGNIAAGLGIQVGEGNGLNALAIAQLREVRFEIGSSSQTTFEGYYRDTTASLGIRTQESSRMVDNQHSLLNQLINRRESVTGVSLDEEMSNLMRFQHAYQAAARIVTTLDTMLDTVINRMGVR